MTVESRNLSFYLRFQSNSTIKISTLFDFERKNREFPLNDVADLIQAYQNFPGSLLSKIDPGLVTLHLPDGTPCPDREFFMTDDVNDTALRSGLALMSLGTLGTDDRHPLVLKLKGDFTSQDQGIFIVLLMKCTL